LRERLGLVVHGHVEHRRRLIQMRDEDGVMGHQQRARLVKEML